MYLETMNRHDGFYHLSHDYDQMLVMEINNTNTSGTRRGSKNGFDFGLDDLVLNMLSMIQKQENMSVPQSLVAGVHQLSKSKYLLFYLFVHSHFPI